MPLITISHNPYAGGVGSDVIESLAKALPSIVAEALTVPGTDGELHASEIEVEIRDFRAMEVHGENKLEITVLANDYPARRANLDERRQQITREVRDFLGSIMPVGDFTPKGFVWVLLAPGSFEQL